MNDFAFKIATANGTGSASADGLIMQAIFRMGIPVTGKNVFPSNISGPADLANPGQQERLHRAHPNFDLMVASTRRRIRRTSRKSAPNGWLLFDLSWPLDDHLKRPDVTYLAFRSPRCATPPLKASASAS